MDPDGGGDGVVSKIRLGRETNLDNVGTWELSKVLRLLTVSAGTGRLYDYAG